MLSRDRLRKYIPLDLSIDYVERDAAISELVTVTEHVIASRDPNDNKFLSLAVVGRADCVTRGDNGLLGRVEFKGVHLYRPAEFVRLFIP